MRNVIALIVLAAAVLPVVAGQAQSVDICDRTPQVRDALLEAVDADDCAAVDSARLAGVETLDISAKQVTALRTGDFDGLSSLRQLRLDGNHQLAALPDSVFDGLASLRQLHLDGNQLTALPDSVDDQGGNAGPVTLTLPAGESRTVSAFDLENGARGLNGALGDGAGKWRLLITAGSAVVGMSLLESASGRLTNISTAGVAVGGR